MYTVTLKKNEEKRLLAGHPWVYANEVAKIEGKDVQGGVCRVVAADGRFVGQGFINHQSKIIVRILSRDERVIDREFFFKRISAANEFRRSLGYNDNYRIAFGESDLLPGLIVDKYADVLAVQFLCLGADVRKEMITEILVELFAPACVYERSDVSVRTKEGLPETKGVLYGALPEELIIVENGVKLKIDVANGQKTGYFLDQKENRERVKDYVRGKRVLDLFCNQGGFSLCAAKGGASEITAVDISASALAAVGINAALNGIDGVTTVQADVFELLREYKREGRTFDVIILDPPAFIKSKDAVKEGYNGYRDINTLALKLLASDGVLITCSCSQHMSLNLFIDMLRESTLRAGKDARIAEIRFQGRDHASLLSADEGQYLKSVTLKLCADSSR
ncbi:MAG: class I SAM-dependent rRNA methyltransferase [Clostridiaceae bacterium]|jgi:23S rRNA (cytosine1962-C5)-methyltransferase|nr:class I SAM-dependent rRNA methyltransferase [Clostridiaceae bacterium]